jgi:hypothetical protein
VLVKELDDFVLTGPYQLNMRGQGGGSSEGQDRGGGENICSERTSAWLLVTMACCVLRPAQGCVEHTVSPISP